MSTYTPELNDYVIWDKGKFSVEGWVYFVDQEYITIEVGVKPKHPESYQDMPLHQNNRLLVVCYVQSWNQLKYVTKRISKYNNEVPSDLLQAEKGQEEQADCYVLQT